ncbi:cell wall-binding repeat-containing protein [Jeotgalibacillus marinus]|uniref:Cell wall-binding repeat-containing protein n=1 Tax=Jeotgalibacillus marinus TaxID=86667 RepID=A0ABV3Q4V2_9BACL
MKYLLRKTLNSLTLLSVLAVLFFGSNQALATSTSSSLNNVVFGDSETTGQTQTPGIQDVTNTDHFYGSNRYETAALISQRGWSRSDTVVLVRGDEFTDAIAAVPLAHKLDAPMLVNGSDVLNDETKQEIERLGAKEVIIIGGYLSINQDVEQQIKALGVAVDRINGSTRYDTAKIIAEQLGNNHDEAIVINVNAFTDGIAIAPYAAREGIPILFTEKDYIPKETKDILDQVKSTTVLGGYLVISDDILRQMPAPNQIAGATVYSTTDMVIKLFNSSRNQAYVVSRDSFADGMTASVLAAKNDESIIFSNANQLLDVPRQTMNLFDNITIIGGPFSPDLVEEIRNR